MHSEKQSKQFKPSICCASRPVDALKLSKNVKTIHYRKKVYREINNAALASLGWRCGYVNGLFQTTLIKLVQNVLGILKIDYK